MLTFYPAIMFKDADSDVGIVFPDLPGCTSAGRSAEEALIAAREAAQLYIDSLVEDGEPVPRPSALESVARTYAGEDGFLSVALVPARRPGKARRVQITLDEHLLDDVDSAAAASGMSRSGWLADAARHGLRNTGL